MRTDIGDVLISVDELASALRGGAAPLVLDARWNLVGRGGREEFEEGHVPGARFVRMKGALAGPAGAGGRHPLPAPVEFEAEMRRVGVDDGPLVVMDGGAPLAAARLWWLLTDAGHDHVRVLDGGFAAWRAAGHEIATGTDDATSGGGMWTARPGRHRVVDIDAVAALAAASTASSSGVAAGRIVDVRAAPRFRGEHEPIDPVAGHIPGACNVEATASFRDGLFRPAAELAEHFAERRVDAESIVYCGSGPTACQTLLAMAVAGLTPARLFVGSWSAWVAAGDRPVAIGD